MHSSPLCITLHTSMTIPCQHATRNIPHSAYILNICFRSSGPAFFQHSMHVKTGLYEGLSSPTQSSPSSSTGTHGPLPGCYKLISTVHNHYSADETHRVSFHLVCVSCNFLRGYPVVGPESMLIVPCILFT